MEMTSLLLICVLWGESPLAGPGASGTADAETRQRDGKEYRYGPKLPPSGDRYGRPTSGRQPSEPKSPASAAERAETEAEAAEITEAGGPDVTQPPRTKALDGEQTSPPQSSFDRNSESPADAQSSSGQPPLAAVQGPAVRAGEAEALVRALTNPTELALPGAPAPLIDLMSRLVDRRQQIEVTQTYWNLWGSVAEYRIAADHFARLQQFLPPADASGRPPGDPLVEARLSAAEARLREVEADVLTDQYALAELAHQHAGAELPLPSDFPLTSGYMTRFDRVYSNTAPPPRAVLIDRSLPLRHRAIEMRAAAAAAAAHAAEGDFDAYAQGQADLTPALDSVHELARQQRAFVAAVRDYNRDIAEYALSIAPPGLAGPKLVGMLISSPADSQPRAADSSGAEPAEGVRRAGFDQPFPARIRSAGPSAESTEPAAAAGPKATDQEPTPAALEPTPANAEPAPGNVESAPVDEPNVPFRPGGEPARPLAPGEKQPANAPGGKIRSQPFSTRKPPLDSGAGVVAQEEPLGLYPALVELPPPQRTQELGTTLHWARHLPDGAGLKTGLAECLSWAGPGPQRRAMIETYWQTCHRLARYQAIAQQAEQLQSLDPAALQWRNHRDGAEAMLRLKAAQRAAQADLVEAELDVKVGQFMLAQLGGRPLKGEWPLPDNAPHAGRYRLKLESQPQEIRQLAAVRRLVASVSALYGALEAESAAVVQCDLNRADATLRYEQGQTLIGEPLDAIRDQLEETLAFLRVQAEYNLQYADYVLAVLPPGAGNDLLAKALIIRRSNG